MSDKKSKKVTRSLKFEITFPGLRDKDRPSFQKKLWTLQDELTLACNRLISALFQLRLGHIETPKKDDGEPVSHQTLVYQGLSGKWQPFDAPFYRPSDGFEAGSMVLLDIASMVWTRIQTDYKDVLRGEKSLSTFRRNRRGGVAVGIAGKGITVDDKNNISLAIWAGRGASKVKIRPRKLDGSQRSILRRISSGEYDFGSGKLWYDKRPMARGKWMFSLSWTREAVEGGESRHDDLLVAGVHLGIANAATLSYVDLEDGTLRNLRDVIHFPESTVRAWNRLHNERWKRSVFNRKEYGLRLGRGRKRKLRAVDALSGKVSDLTTSTVRQMAAAVVAAAKNRGAVGIALEDLTHWSVAKVHSEADNETARTAADLRRRYFRWHQGALRAQIRSAAERENMLVVEVNPENDSRTCSVCEKVWADTGIYRPKGKPAANPEYGRVKWDKWVCSCGARRHADHNASSVVARRGYEALRDKFGDKETDVQSEVGVPLGG